MAGASFRTACLGPGVGLRLLSSGICLQSREVGPCEVALLAFTLSKGLCVVNKQTAVQEVRALTPDEDRLRTGAKGHLV